jgi:DNA-binding GntR family transcriptional regulator
VTSPSPASFRTAALETLARASTTEEARLTASELVRSRLRRAILNGDLPGGTPLALAEVAAALGVSTTPVREAFRMLSSEGFIDMDPYRGGIVRTLDRAEIEEVVRIRHLLEPVAVEEAIAGLDEDMLERAGAVLAEMLANPGSERWVEWNRRFHDTLYEGARSRRLIALLRTLQDPVMMYVSAALERHAGFRDEANRQHVALYEAMRARDVAAATELTLRHVALPVKATEEVMEEQ